MRRRATIGLALAWTVLAVATATPAQGQGRGQGAIVVRDEAPIYTKSEGEKIIAKVARGYAVGGIGFKVNSFVAEIENGRAHILYLGTSQGPIGAVKGSTEKNALGKQAWMNQNDLAFFNYECGCGEKNQTCAAIETAGWISERWNQCFIEARDKKLAELKAGWEKGAAGETTAEGLADSSRHASSGEKALTNGDVVAEKPPDAVREKLA